MRLIIVRHGETEANANGIWQGHRHGRLSKNGIVQVNELARRLKNEKIGVIYSSELRRTAHTTNAVANFHDVPVHHVTALREISLGIHEGKPYHMFTYQTDAKHIRMGFKPKGGESHADVKRRLKAFTTALYKKHRNDTVLLSTHGIVAKCLVSIYLGTPLDELLGVRARNAGFLILEVKDSRARKIKDELFYPIT